MNHGVHPGQAPTHAVPIEDRPPDRVGRGQQVEPDGFVTMLTKPPQQALAEMAGAAGYENAHRLMVGEGGDVTPSRRRPER